MVRTEKVGLAGGILNEPRGDKRAQCRRELASTQPARDDIKAHLEQNLRKQVTSS
jgi:hypothetical protein